MTIKPIDAIVNTIIWQTELDLELNKGLNTDLCEHVVGPVFVLADIKPFHSRVRSRIAALNFHQVNCALKSFSSITCKLNPCIIDPVFFRIM